MASRFSRALTLLVAFTPGLTVFWTNRAIALSCDDVYCWEGWSKFEIPHTGNMAMRIVDDSVVIQFAGNDANMPVMTINPKNLQCTQQDSTHAVCTITFRPKQNIPDSFRRKVGSGLQVPLTRLYSVGMAHNGVPNPEDHRVRGFLEIRELLRQLADESIGTSQADEFQVLNARNEVVFTCSQSPEIQDRPCIH